jgi:hypothetical protein
MSTRQNLRRTSGLSVLGTRESETSLGFGHAHQVFQMEAANEGSGRVRPKRLICLTDFAPLGQSGGKGQGLADILLFEIGKICQEFRDCTAHGYCFDNHADSDAHPADAGLAAHPVGIDRDPLKLLHCCDDTANPQAL